MENTLQLSEEFRVSVAEALVAVLADVERGVRCQEVVLEAMIAAVLNAYPTVGSRLGFLADNTPVVYANGEVAQALATAYDHSPPPGSRRQRVDVLGFDPKSGQPHVAIELKAFGNLNENAHGLQLDGYASRYPSATLVLLGRDKKLAQYKAIAQFGALGYSAARSFPRWRFIALSELQAVVMAVAGCQSDADTSAMKLGRVLARTSWPYRAAWMHESS